MNQNLSKQPSDLILPTTNWKDWLHALGKGTLGAVPLAGNLCSEIFQLALASPFQKRTEEWQRKVVEVLADLHANRGIDIEKLLDDPAFYGTVMQAGRIAMTAAELEKLDALRNAIANSALPEAPHVAERVLFLRYVDEFSGLHLQLIAFWDNPKKWFATHDPKPPNFGSPPNTGRLEAVLHAAFPDLARNQNLRDLLSEELQNRRLVANQSLLLQVDSHAAMSSRLTPFGHQFLRFIREPSPATPRPGS